MSSPHPTIIRDPVHGNIEVHSPFILDLIDHPLTQRLRRIRQLAMCFNVFPGAEHSRFQHILGVYWLMQRVLRMWQRKGWLTLSPQDHQCALAAALLHDVGHGPFSHALEFSLGSIHHEKMGMEILKTYYRETFQKHGLELETTLDILSHRHPIKAICELVSSQLDVDRMDYLQRDSLYTGVKYGLFDIERILHTILPLKQTQEVLLAIDRKGTEAAEEFLFSRYFMHWQIYLHKTVRASESLLRNILLKARSLLLHDPTFPCVSQPLQNILCQEDLNTQKILGDFIKLDDFILLTQIKQWQHSKEKTLSDLCLRFSQRRGFKAIPIAPDKGSKLVEVATEIAHKEFGEQAPYYLSVDHFDDSIYDIYRPLAGSPIRVASDGEWSEITQTTRTSAITALAQKQEAGFLFVAPELVQKIRRTISDEEKSP